MNIILRLVFWKLVEIAVKISFLCVPKHGVYAATSFSAIVTSRRSRNDPQILRLFVYENISRFIAQ